LVVTLTHELDITMLDEARFTREEEEEEEKEEEEEEEEQLW
jgi:hypothetical protein